MFGGDIDMQMHIIDAAAATGVTRFMPHQFGHKHIEQRDPKECSQVRRTVQAWDSIWNGTALPFMVSAQNHLRYLACKRVGRAVACIIEHWDELKITTSTPAVPLHQPTCRECTVGNYDVEECTRKGEARTAKGFPDSGMFLLDRSILYDELLNASGPFISKSANRVLGLSAESVNEIVQNASHDPNHHGKPGCGCSA
ncbi:hypothetical protein IAQ61_011020 [Plenodomus lingam]|uniref:uncharacterized protein n=1 Tax=Leptosphaeria maculans TaxID=5022 RepID=UPI00332E777A|nr:hypothetical protein IAQ61_011020 [Plenodomus lingam]